MSSEKNDIYGEIRPEVPKDLTEIPLSELERMRGVLSRFKMSAESQLASVNAEFRRGGRMIDSVYDDIVSRQKKIKRFKVSVEYDNSRIGSELTRRHHEKLKVGASCSSHRSKPKGMVFPLLMELCEALSEDERVSNKVGMVAGNLAEVLKVIVENDNKEETNK